MKATPTYILLIILSLILFVLELTFGSVSIPFRDVLTILLDGDHSNQAWEVIVIQTRLPRAISAICAGMFLSVSGLFMQTLFRNPLAGPHILGVSSGAGLGVALVVMGLGGLTIAYVSEFLIALSAFIGSISILFLLFVISVKVKDVLTVLIFGVLLGAVSMAIVGILQYLSTESQLKVFLIWTLGSFDGVSLSEAGLMFFLGIPILISAIWLLKSLNLLLIGEDYARSMGLNTNKARLLILLLAGGLTALATAFCGPIGFVGVVVPHFARMISKSYDHNKLLPLSLLIGMNVMLFSDLISHVPGSDMILPINSITSLIGVPFIFWMLLKNKVVSQV